MLRNILVSSIFLLTITLSESLECTGFGEVETCSGPYCERTCDNYDLTVFYCSYLFCSPICFCKEPYVRDLLTKKCVEKQECRAAKLKESQTCKGPREVYEECGDVNCQFTCKNYKKEELECLTDDCNEACVCKKPFVRDEVTNQCITAEECIRREDERNQSNHQTSRTCERPGEVFEDCAALNCEWTCKNYKEKELLCFTNDCHGICVCQYPFVRDESTNQCITPDECEIRENKRNPKNTNFYSGFKDKMKNYYYNFKDGVKDVWGKYVGRK